VSEPEGHIGDIGGSASEAWAVTWIGQVEAWAVSCGSNRTALSTVRSRRRGGPIA